MVDARLTRPATRTDRIVRRTAVVLPYAYAAGLVLAASNIAFAAAAFGFSKTITDLLGNFSETILTLSSAAAILVMAYGLFKGMVMGAKDTNAHADGMKIFKQALVAFALLMLVKGIVGFIGKSGQELNGQIG